MVRFSQYAFKENQWASLSEVPFAIAPVQSHRGFCQKGALENSISSIQAAFEEGYKMVEMDLRLNREGKIILFHDPIRFQPHLKDAALLEEALDFLPKDSFYNLEIKNESRIVFPLEEKLIHLLKHHPKKDQLLFSSFNPLSLAWMARLLPEIPRALLVTQETEPGNSFFLREMTLLPLAKPHFLNCRWEDLDHYKEVPWERKVVWTLNDASYAKTLLSRQKVKSVITDTILPSEIAAAY